MLEDKKRELEILKNKHTSLKNNSKKKYELELLKAIEIEKKKISKIREAQKKIELLEYNKNKNNNGKIVNEPNKSKVKSKIKTSQNNKKIKQTYSIDGIPIDLVRKLKKRNNVNKTKLINNNSAVKSVILIKITYQTV